MKAQRIAVTGILAAIICLLAPLSVPVGAVPISLATFAIYITACTVSVKISVPAVIIYILLGAAGLPVFSSFQGGIHLITGVTGGYILGYIPCTLIIGYLIGKYENNKAIYPLSMAMGTAVCYLAGTAWYMLHTGNGFASSLTVCVLPFIISDSVKITAACVIGFTLRKRLSRLSKLK